MEMKMSLLEELKEKRQDSIEIIAGIDIDIEATKLTLKSEQERRALWTKRIIDLDRAIAALTPAPEAPAHTQESAAAEAEGADYQPTDDDVVWALESVGIDPATGEVPDQSETTEIEPDPVLRAFEDDHIVAPSMPIDAQTCEPVDPRVSWDAEPGPHPDDASVFAGEHEPNGRAPVTDPEADAIAGAHDYYSPEAQASREREEGFLNRFNPFRTKADA
jgi:hypothetical protein